MNGFDSLTSLPHNAQIAVGILAAIQLCLMLIAVVVLARTPHTRIAGHSKLVWLVVIVLGQCVGPIAFLYLDRREKSDDRQRQAYDRESVSTPTHTSINQTVAHLYGDRS